MLREELRLLAHFTRQNVHRYFVCVLVLELCGELSRFWSDRKRKTVVDYLKVSNSILILVVIDIDDQKKLSKNIKYINTN